MKKARRLLRLNRIAQGAIVAGILVAANLIAQSWFARLDLTEHGAYTLAPATRKALAALDDTVVVTAYFSGRLPPYLENLRRDVRDMLDEYRALAGGRLSVEFADPAADPAARSRVRALGIPELQLQVVERDEFQVRSAFLGIALLYGGRQEVLPVVEETGNLEYELTAAILRLTNPSRKVVGWASWSEPDGDPREGGGPLRREIAKLYDLRELAPASLAAVPDAVETLVVDAPHDLPADAVGGIERFVGRGGRAIFLVDHFDLPAGTLEPAPFDSGVLDLLARWGAKVNRDVVAEPLLNAPAAFASGFVQFRVAYPYWVRVPRESLDAAHPSTARIEDLVLPWASSIEAAVPAGAPVKATALAKSTPDAWVESGAWDFSPQPGKVRGAKGPGGERTLALLLTGRFTPAPPPGGAAVPAAEGPETSVLVVGTSRLARAEFLRQFPQNGTFILNAVDWMTLGQDLIGIRPREAAERTLMPVPPRTRALVRLVTVVGIPLTVVLLALARLGRRRRRPEEA